jgi:hypothetical protein
VNSRKPEDVYAAHLVAFEEADQEYRFYLKKLAIYTTVS